MMKFVIVGSARTGSNLLLNLLKAHPSVEMHGEIFNLNSLKGDDQRFALQDPLGYLNKKFTPEKPTTTAVGFKLFYFHAVKEQLMPGYYPDNLVQFGSAQIQRKINGFHQLVEQSYDVDELAEKLADVWRSIEQDTSIKIIHLKRANKLKTHLSLRKAFRSSRWAKNKNVHLKRAVRNIFRNPLGWKERKQRQSEAPLYLGYDECLQAFEAITEQEQRCAERFANHDTMTLQYESLVADLPGELSRVADFLGLDASEDLAPANERQGGKSLINEIENYAELKSQFAGSGWADFFVE